MLNEQQFYLFGQIQTSQTGGQPYCDASSCDEGSLPGSLPIFEVCCADQFPRFGFLIIDWSAVVVVAEAVLFF